MSKVLAIESSTTWASTCIVENGILLAEQSSGSPRNHSEFLNDAIENNFKKLNINISNVNLIAVGIGPGSFTGIRVALNIAKTFSYLTKTPIYICDSLSILHQQTGQDCLTMINAYKNMVYWAAFVGNKKIDGPNAVFIDDLEKKIAELHIDSPIYCVGDGYIAYENFFSPKLKQLLKRNQSLDDFPRALTLAKMAETNHENGKFLDWKSIIPLYIRASEAEENFRKNK
jgi:N6-L-threonylcarbamoyladenine synthase/tRNA threonylcarbamoyladenosine biosynthesis protein TsaB